ncbi:protein BTG1-like [Scleropages formosus]|uniref:Protein BTG1 n=2 Tax=Scleropages formosus TaxID=113540 RepID=A0A0P7VS56_SCLFO|nr:protein BTG1-like [Scleropages formosus]
MIGLPFLPSLLVSLWHVGGGCIRSTYCTETITLVEEGLGFEGGDVAPSRSLLLRVKQHRATPRRTVQVHLPFETSPPRQINAQQRSPRSNTSKKHDSEPQPESEQRIRRKDAKTTLSMHTLRARGTMKPEIAAAVGFLSRFLRIKGHVNDRQLQTFSQSLQDMLAEQYQHHWFPDRPCKGSGYRCIRINHKMDPLVGQAGQRIGLSIQQLYGLLPSELTLWVDPFEVSYRIGEDGSICVLYESQPTAVGGTASATTSSATSSASASPGGLSTLVDSRISCKEELLLGRTSPSKAYNMMTVSS